MLPALPATLAAKASLLEAEALAYARKNVRMIRDEKISWWDLPLSWFETSDSRRLAKVWLRTMAKHPHGLMDITNLGRIGWGLAHEVVCELIVEHQHNNRDMPPPLATYNMELARAAGDPQRRYRRMRGREKADLLLRDIAIIFCVGDVCWKFDIPPTRQAASKRERLSGCKVVAQAMAEEGLALSESDIVSIWTRYGRMAFPGGVKALGPYPFPL
jgi:hypothetical protein